MCPDREFPKISCFLRKLGNQENRKLPLPSPSLVYVKISFNRFTQKRFCRGDYFLLETCNLAHIYHAWALFLVLYYQRVYIYIICIMYNWYFSIYWVCKWLYLVFDCWMGRARGLVPPTRNCTVESLTFRVIARVSLSAI